VFWTRGLRTNCCIVGIRRFHLVYDARAVHLCAKACRRGAIPAPRLSFQRIHPRSRDRGSWPEIVLCLTTTASRPGRGFSTPSHSNGLPPAVRVRALYTSASCPVNTSTRG